MWRFKKHKKQETTEHIISFKDKVAGKIAVRLMNVQSTVSNYINKHICKIGLKNLKLILAFFCLVTCGYSLYLIANGITTGSRNTYIPLNFTAPKHIGKTGDNLMNEGYITEESFNKIQLFKKYMDSLKYTNRSAHDSMVSARPLLMDTIMLLEELYRTQNK